MALLYVLQVISSSSRSKSLTINMCCTVLGGFAGDLLDVEARSRARSLYFPFGSVPMFPRCLSEGPFSLGDPTTTISSSSSSSGPNAEACDAFSICITLSDNGSLQEVVKLGPSRVRVSHHMVYDEVDADLGMGPGLCQHEDLQLLYEAARLRCEGQNCGLRLAQLPCSVLGCMVDVWCILAAPGRRIVGNGLCCVLLSGAVWGALVHPLASCWWQYTVQTCARQAIRCCHMLSRAVWLQACVACVSGLHRHRPA
jgi:hypothetical protein